MSKLIKFIEAHGFRVVSNTDTTITAMMQFCANGKAWEEEETMDANLQAVRDWLGY